MKALFLKTMEEGKPEFQYPSFIADSGDYERVIVYNKRKRIKGVKTHSSIKAYKKSGKNSQLEGVIPNFSTHRIRALLYYLI